MIEIERIGTAAESTGYQLLSRLMATDAGASQPSLEVAADNTAVLALYRGRGFRQVGGQENYYGPRNNGSTSKDALILRLDLT